MAQSHPEDFNPKTDFRYVIGEKENLVLVMLYGKISSREMAGLEQIENILNDKTQRIFLLNFHDVTAVMPASHQFLVKLQKKFRDAGKLIGICTVHPDTKISLLHSGIVRETELFNNIPYAWKTLQKKALANPLKTTSQTEEKAAA